MCCFIVKCFCCVLVVFRIIIFHPWFCYYFNLLFTFCSEIFARKARSRLFTCRGPFYLCALFVSFSFAHICCWGVICFEREGLLRFWSRLWFLWILVFIHVKRCFFFYTVALRGNGHSPSMYSERNLWKLFHILVGLLEIK